MNVLISWSVKCDGLKLDLPTTTLALLLANYIHDGLFTVSGLSHYTLCQATQIWDAKLVGMLVDFKAVIQGGGSIFVIVIHR